MKRRISSNDDDDSYYPIVKVNKNDSDLQLYLPFPLSSQLSLSPSTKIAKWKDERLELVDIPKGLIEILQNAGFTIEKILECEPSHIAEKLALDNYMAQTILDSTRKSIASKIIQNFLIN